MKLKAMEAGAHPDRDYDKVEPNRPAYLWDAKIKKVAAKVGKSIEKREKEDGTAKR